MKYVITQKQYNLIIEQQYGDIISLGGTATPDPNAIGYGDIIPLSGKKSQPQATTTTDKNKTKFDVFTDINQKRIFGNYPLKKIREISNKQYELELGPLKMTTNCEKLKKGDYSFSFSGRNLYSKELAKKVGEQFNCKLKD